MPNHTPVHAMSANVNANTDRAALGQSRNGSPRWHQSEPQHERAIHQEETRAHHGASQDRHERDREPGRPAREEAAIDHAQRRARGDARRDVEHLGREEPAVAEVLEVLAGCERRQIAEIVHQSVCEPPAELGKPIGASHAGQPTLSLSAPRYPGWWEARSTRSFMKPPAVRSSCRSWAPARDGGPPEVLRDDGSKRNHTPSPGRAP